MRSDDRPAPFTNDDDGVRLTLEACTACGALYFPPRGYGCEACGAAPEALRPRPAEARARVVASSAVSFAPGSDLAVPATVAQLDLVDPVVRFYGVLAGNMQPAGTLVEAAVTTGDGGAELLRFRTAEQS